MCKREENANLDIISQNYWKQQNTVDLFEMLSLSRFEAMKEITEEETKQKRWAMLFKQSY